MYRHPRSTDPDEAWPDDTLQPPLPSIQVVHTATEHRRSCATYHFHRPDAPERMILLHVDTDPAHGNATYLSLELPPVTEAAEQSETQRRFTTCAPTDPARCQPDVQGLDDEDFRRHLAHIDPAWLGMDAAALPVRPSPMPGSPSPLRLCHFPQIGSTHPLAARIERLIGRQVQDGQLIHGAVQDDTGLWAVSPSERHHQLFVRYIQRLLDSAANAPQAHP